MSQPRPPTSQRTGPPLSSNDIGTSNPHLSSFIETLEHQRFAEFCEACRRYRYIGLCYGPPGVGKTLSARRYSRWDQIQASDRWSLASAEEPRFDTVLYTPPVVNAPGRIAADIQRSRERLQTLARRPLQREREEKWDEIRQQEEEQCALFWHQPYWWRRSVSPLQPLYEEVAREYSRKIRQIDDPTTLLLLDEADRLRMASLEQVRAIFDAGEIGMILIGMPGIEKRLARYPQFYSRIGFVHEFRPLRAAAVRQLLDQGWSPPGVRLPPPPWNPEAVAMILRITGGNFRLLHRLLTQMERILEINGLKEVNKPVVEAARESLVIGPV